MSLRFGYINLIVRIYSCIDEGECERERERSYLDGAWLVKGDLMSRFGSQLRATTT